MAYTHSAEWGLVMAGGSRNRPTEFLKTVKATKDGSNFEDLPDLPVATDNSCMAVVDPNTLFVAGGTTEQGHTAHAYFFSRIAQVSVLNYKEPPSCHLGQGRSGNPIPLRTLHPSLDPRSPMLGPKRPTAVLYSIQEWHDLGEMPGGARDRSVCGLVRYPNGDLAAIVAGGFSFEGTGYEVDLFHFPTGTWRALENALPMPAFGMTAVPYGDAFITVGGVSDNYNMDTVMVFDRLTESFKVLEDVRLDAPKSYVSAMFVDALSFECYADK